MEPETKLQISSVEDVPQSTSENKPQSRPYAKSGSKQTRMNLLRVSSFVLAFAVFGFFIFLLAQSAIQQKKVTIGPNSDVTVDAPRILDSTTETSADATGNSNVEPTVDPNVESNVESTVDPNTGSNVDPTTEENVASDADLPVDENPASDVDSSDLPDGNSTENPVVTPIVLQTIPEARAYFDDKEEDNLLLVSANWTDSHIALTFEDTTDEVQLSLSIVSTLYLNKDTEKAYITYMDETRQIIPYYSGEELEIDSSNVVVDPYSNCPLGARITFKTQVPGKIKLTIRGRDAESHDLVHQFNEMATNHIVPVVGLYENYNNLVTIEFTDSKGKVRASKDLNIQTAGLNEAQANGFKLIIKEKNTYSKPLFMLIRGIVYDEQGYIRWYEKDLTTMYPAGPGVVGSIKGGTTGKLFSWLGETLLTFDVPTGIHHEITEKTPGGNILVASGVSNGEEDAIVEIDRATGAIVKTWDLRNYFDEKRPQRDTKLPIKLHDWLHINTVKYDPKDNTLLLSSRNQCFFSKIGYDDGTVKYISGSHDDWVEPYTKYLLTPTNFNTTLHIDQDWTYFQHTPTVLTNGNIIIYDNGGGRPGFTNNPAADIFELTGMKYFTAYKPAPPPGYARAVEYSVDYDAMTITKVWEHADFPNLMTTVIGSVSQLDENTIMIGYGEIGAVTLIDKPSKKRLFRAQIRQASYRMIPVDLYEGY